MRHLALLLLALLLPAGAQAQSPNIPSTTNTIAIAGTVAARTTIVTGVANTRIYVTALALVPVATAAVTFSTGTGTNCGTNTATVSGVMTFAAGADLNFGSGLGTIMVAPLGHDLCITVGTAAAPGTLSYAQF